MGKLFVIQHVAHEILGTLNPLLKRAGFRIRYVNFGRHPAGHTGTVFQWHGDTFDIAAGAIHLAASPLCVNQAFRYGEKVNGLQFHLEVDQAMILRWLKLTENRHEIAKLPGCITPDHIYTATARHIGRLHELSSKTFGEFIALFGPEKIRCGLASG